MLADGNKLPPNSKLTFLRRVISVFIKAAVLLMLLFVFDKLLPSISQQTQSFVMAKWQQLILLQQPLPTENSLPSPLPEQHLTDTWGGARSQGRSHEGIVVFIIGPGGAGHYYAHLEDYADISPNDWVNSGDIIGYVGDSGNAKGTPPHVHYGIYINGSAVNPYPLLQKPES